MVYKRFFFSALKVLGCPVYDITKGYPISLALMVPIACLLVIFVGSTRDSLHLLPYILPHPSLNLLLSIKIDWSQGFIQERGARQ